MALTKEDQAIAAGLLREATITGKPIPPLTAQYGGIDVEDAYNIQLINIAHQISEGERVQGHKVGLSSKAMQRMLNVNEPDYGHLLTSMFIFDEDEVVLADFIQPRVEIEIAFILGQPLVGPGRTIADVLRATEYVMPAIEIVDSRIAEWAIALPDTIADNASSGAVILGGSPKRLTDVDIKLTGGILRSNGRVAETGVSGAVLGNPMVAVAWLANKVASFGIALEPGHVIMPGSLTRMIPVESGDAIRAEFHNLGDVGVSFS